MRRARWKRKSVRAELAPHGPTHPYEGAAGTHCRQNPEVPTGCAENPQMTSKYIPASAGAAFIWLQRGYPLPPFPLPLPILWGWFPKAGAEAPGLCVVGGPGRIETPWCFSSGVWGGFFSRKECAPRPCGGNCPLREQETMRKRAASPRAFLLSEIMTAARRNSKLFVKGNDRFDLMKADFIT